MSTPLHILISLGNELAEKHSVKNAVLTGKWDDDGRLIMMEVIYDSTPGIFENAERIGREMNHVMCAAHEVLEEYNRKAEAENSKEEERVRREQNAGKVPARARHTAIFRPRSYVVIARFRSGGGCSKEKVEEKKLEYNEAVFLRIRQFERRAKMLAAQIKKQSGLSVEIVPASIFPSGPYGVTIRASGVPEEHSAKILKETADWVLASWRYAPAKLSWVKVVDTSTGRTASAGKLPGEKNRPKPQPEPESRQKPKPRPEPESAPEK
jgi:hypothetical protein